MGMTMTQKILAKHAGLDQVEAGQLIEARLDMVLGNDITAPVAITEMCIRDRPWAMPTAGASSTGISSPITSWSCGTAA